MEVICDRQREKAEADRGQRVVSDTDTMTKVMNFGQKCRKDGYIDWHKGNIEEALSSWRQADDHLKRHRLPDDHTYGNKMVADLHGIILKNIAQAAIRLGYWTEALEAADDALRIDDQDHKAWFRRACALEGLGRFEEEEKALARIEELAVGRPDRDRIQKDTQLKREKIQTIKDKDSKSQKRILLNGVENNLFSE